VRRGFAKPAVAIRSICVARHTSKRPYNWFVHDVHLRLAAHDAQTHIEESFARSSMRMSHEDGAGATTSDFAGVRRRRVTLTPRQAQRSVANRCSEMIEGHRRSEVPGERDWRANMPA
jgi:hypothetical protein